MSSWPTLVIEDQLLFRDLLVKLIAGDNRYRCVGVAGDAVAGLELCRQLQPHLILLDLNLPGMSGLELARRLRDGCATARILALTSRQDESAITGIFELGLPGYVEKSQPIEVLEEAMLAVAQGRTYFTPTFAAVRRRMARDPDAISKVLSAREREILRLVGCGHSGPQIARTLGLSPRTVGNHRYRLMKKLRLRSTAEVVAFALRASE
jgi:two-component system secretion response regulator SsrB